MRVILLVLLVGCSSKGAAPAWTCTDSICFATPAACAEFVAGAAGVSSCGPRPVAFCSHGCQPSQNGAYPSCRATCATDLDTCKAMGGRTCQQEAPPDPIFHDRTPGFWCFQYQGAPGRPSVSWCTKYREECDYLIDDTLAKLGGNRQTAPQIVGAGCQQASSAYCWTRLVQGEHVPVCVMTAEMCVATRATATSAAATECRLVSSP